ncbi:heterocyst frequency control protein PatD [Leptolyngbya sp. FACHB-261]|uniref:heterocyst frequency control protein PatD n=1 Tax=Leptolyngbya sp. FACHB-261 TaxID=2692806 RepID=UPI001681F054|nr:heterocyst frequency control protein PatD [Leptolyngbya sp. FACHB-261]MBD2099278.1 heterocyst frequency control protein PatD [Leptolyngbya sp. FACHB-261]
MLPDPHRQSYLAFQERLDQLQTLVGKANPAPAQLLQVFLEAQQFFQVQVLGLDAEVLPLETEQQLRAYQTEIQRELRLLGTDLSFLQAARKPETVQQRQGQIQQRLATLSRYCKAILGEGGEGAGA